MTGAPVDGMLDRCVLGRYRVLRKLAKGGMGAVYLARIEGAEGFARPVVVKRVLPTLMGDPEIAQLFVREARILADLRHPNIVAVLDFGRERDGGYVTVFEYVNGYSLAAWHTYVRHSSGLMPLEFALHLGSRLLDALDYAHTFRRADGTPMQVIHRDVSPSNLLLSDQGTVKLLDFGIAQVSGERTDGHGAKPRIRGQLPYLAPELFRGEPASVRSDIYSAGVVIYELLTGSNPFAGRETNDIYQKIVHTIPASVHAVRDDAPEDLDRVLGRALHKDPKRRYQTAAEFARALRALRRLPEEAVATALTKQLGRDFAGPLPEALGLEPLHVREAAWREGVATAVAEAAATEPLTADPSTDPTQDFAVDDYPVTVAAELSPGLLVEATREAAHEQAPPPTRARRTVLIACLAALAGIAATALVGLALRPQEQPMVVIERSAPARSANAVPSTPAGAVAKQVAPSSRAGEAAAAEPAAIAAAEPTPDRARAGDDPPPPNPRALTRAFERRHERVEACFSQHAAGLHGQPELEVYFRVGKSGRVLDAKLEPASLASTSLGSCLVQVALATRFNPQQQDVSFHIPITARKAAH